jgi:serine/threonine protein kinase
MKNPKTGKEFFRRIHDLRPIKLRELLIYRYQFKLKEAEMFADFIMKILKWYPADRPSACEMLFHPWLSMPDEYNYKMSEIEYKIFELRDQAT